MKRQKSPNQETGLGNRGHMKVLNAARPRDTRILVPEKNRAAQNRAS